MRSFPIQLLVQIFMQEMNHIGVVASNAVDWGFVPQSSQTKDQNIGMCCFSVKHTALRSRSTYWLAWNQNNVSKWNDMSTGERTVFSKSQHYKNPTKLVGLVQSRHHLHHIDMLFVFTMIQLQNCPFDVTNNNYLLTHSSIKCNQKRNLLLIYVEICFIIANFH